ncbi:major facilitator superfamily domain-containing protein 4B-like [Limanda limanda]|uniref:major facilitator superfamily domain-containing protein 4B-like n=1 Tax=Limanda limanda TaxID=27771 RepID=UPI0029C7E296|nr:major facilitator superfamily domain-containing protein 4B-like [Limanda limanda]
MFVDERIVTLFKRNAHHTLTYWSVFFSFGLCIAFLGPTILDLQCQTNSTLSQITWVFFAQQFCLLIGSSIGGIFKKTLFRALGALFVSALVISVIFAIIPFCNNVLLLAIAMAVSGLAMGIIDTIANIQLVTIYQRDSAVFLQALHFFIGFGALVSPLIADSFLSETGCTNHTENHTEIIHHFRSMLRSSPIARHNIPHDTPSHEGGSWEPSVHNAFWIMACINLPVPLAVLFLMYRERLIPCLPNSTPNLLDKDELAMENQQGAEGQEVEQGEHEAGGHGDIFGCCQNDNLRGLPASFFMIHIFGGLVLFMTDGIVGVYAGFVYTYAVTAHKTLSHKTAGYLASIFWAAITAGRLLSIPLSFRIRPVKLLVINLVGAIVTVLVLLIFYESSIFLFVGTGLCGLFLSSIFPSMLAYTEDILDYQGCATSVLVTSAGMGEMVMQVVMGQIIQTQGEYSFLLCGVVIACLGFGFFIGLLLFHRMHRNYLLGTSKKSTMVEEAAGAEQNGSAKTEAKEEKEIVIMRVTGGSAGFLNATVLFLIWLTKQSVGSGLLSAPEVVTAANGGSVTVACQYDPKYKGYTKYWCRGAVYSRCSIEATTVWDGGRSFIADNKEAGVFTVTMTSLRYRDEDVYWCAIKQFGRDIGVPVQLNVSHTVTVVTPTTPTMTLNHDEIGWWATLRWILFISMLGCLISTHIAVWRIQTAKKNMSATTTSPSQVTSVNN